MAVLDPSTPLGKIRLRTGDWKDLVILPDSVVLSALDDCDQNVPRAAQLCAQYILATLTAQTHRRMGSQLETWGAEHFDNYVKFLKATVLNPNLMSTYPVPYTGPQFEDEHPLVQFVEDWNAQYANLGAVDVNTTNGSW